VLALIETFAASYLMKIRRRLSQLRERIDEELRALPPLGSRALLTHLGRKANRALGRIRQPIEPYTPATATLEVAHLAARTRYLPRPYPGRLVLFRPPLPGRNGDPDPALGWRSIAIGGVDIEEIPGWHVPILSEPRVQLLAHRLRLRIQAAERPVG
jgi:thioesterase domain-containing protein